MIELAGKLTTRLQPARRVSSPPARSARSARAQVWGRPQARRRSRAPASWGSPIQNASRLAELVQTIVSAVKAILAGDISGVAQKVENALAGAIPIVLDFLAALIGVGGRIIQTIKNILKAITKPIRTAIDKVLLAIKKSLRKLFSRLKRTPKGKKPEKPKTPGDIVKAVVRELNVPTKATDPAEALKEKKQQAEQLKKRFQPDVPAGKSLKITFLDATPADIAKDGDIDIDVGMSPGEKAEPKVGTGKIVGVLKPSKFEYGATFAKADPLINDTKGQETKGGLPEPFASARKLLKPGNVADRLRREEKAKAEGRPFKPKGGEFAREYVRAHLITAAVGGANSSNNLQITTLSVNGAMTAPELRVAELLKQPAMTASGDEVVDKLGKPITKTFSYKTTTVPGPPDQDSLIGLPPHNVSRTNELRTAEKGLVKSFAINAQEKVLLEGGGEIEGKEKVTPSAFEVQLPATFIPE